MRYIATVNGYTIYFDEDEKSTLPNPHWVCKTGTKTELWFDGDTPFAEIKKMLEWGGNV